MSHVGPHVLMQSVLIVFLLVLIPHAGEPLPPYARLGQCLFCCVAGGLLSFIPNVFLGSFFVLTGRAFLNSGVASLMYLILTSLAARASQPRNTNPTLG